MPSRDEATREGKSIGLEGDELEAYVSHLAGDVQQAAPKQVAAVSTPYAALAPKGAAPVSAAPKPSPVVTPYAHLAAPPRPKVIDLGEEVVEAPAPTAATPTIIINNHPPAGTLRPGEVEERSNEIAAARAAKEQRIADYERANPQPVAPIRSYLRPELPASTGPIRPPLGPVAAAVHAIDPRTMTPEQRREAMSVKPPAPSWNMEADVASGAPQGPGPEEKAKMVNAAYQSLTPGQRGVFTAFRQQGLTPEQIYDAYLAKGAPYADMWAQSTQGM